METMTTLSALTLMPSSKEQSLNFALDIVNRVRAGEIRPETLKAQLQFIQKTIEYIDKEIKDDYTDKFSKMGDDFEFMGWSIKKIDVAGRMDYSNDPVHKELTEKIKEREEMLKGLVQPMADPDSGEIVNPPKRKQGYSYFKFT